MGRSATLKVHRAAKTLATRIVGAPSSHSVPSRSKYRVRNCRRMKSCAHERQGANGFLWSGRRASSKNG
jgi:hypothetical protein